VAALSSNPEGWACARGSLPVARGYAIGYPYVFTPGYLHAEHAIIAAGHGEPVIADKPMALTLQRRSRARREVPVHRGRDAAPPEPLTSRCRGVILCTPWAE
jgi:hypothetical protein